MFGVRDKTTKLEYGGCDNVPRGQSYRAPRKAVIGGYAAMVEL